MDNSASLDLFAILRLLRRRALLIVLCVVVTGAAAYAFSDHQRKKYTAAAQILYRNPQLDQQAAGLPVVATVNPQPQTDTNLSLATLPRVAAETANVMGGGLTRRQIAGAVVVSQETDTSLVLVSATWTSPQFAARLADAYARQVIIDRQRTDAGYYASALRAVNLQFDALTSSQKRSVEGTNLRDRAASLQTLSQLQSNEVQLEQSALVPTSSSSPATARNTALGLVIGLLIGLTLAFLLHRLDRRIREPSDLERLYGVPLLGVVPETAALRVPEDGTLMATPPKETEIFGLLRAHMRYFNVDREMRTVVIVSAASGDGKTTIARNLAVASAMVGSRVLFMETDLRRPAAARHFGVSREPGLSDILLGQMSLDQVVQRVEFATRAEASVGLDILVAGGLLPPNPAQVMESQAMDAVITQAEQEYDLVVIDTPPLALLPDAFPLLRRAHAVLIVSRLGHNRSDVAVRLRDTLASVDAPVVGVVANGYKSPRGSSPYAYGYSYDYSHYSDHGLELAAEPTANGASADKAPAGT